MLIMCYWDLFVSKWFISPSTDIAFQQVCEDESESWSDKWKHWASFNQQDVINQLFLSLWFLTYLLWLTGTLFYFFYFSWFQHCNMIYTPRTILSTIATKTTILQLIQADAGKMPKFKNVFSKNSKQDGIL